MFEVDGLRREVFFKAEDIGLTRCLKQSVTSELIWRKHEHSQSLFTLIFKKMYFNICDLIAVIHHCALVSETPQEKS